MHGANSTHGTTKRNCPLTLAMLDPLRYNAMVAAKTCQSHGICDFYGKLLLTLRK